MAHDEDEEPIKPKRRRKVEEDDSETKVKRKKRKGGFPLWGWLAIGGGGVVMLCFMGLLAVVAWRGVVEKRDRLAAPSPAVAEPTKNLWTDKELSETVRGKTYHEPKPGEERSFEIANGVKMVFCWIPPGKATLGSPKTEKDRHEDEAEHEYTSKGFWLAKYAVTQKEYEAVFGENPSAFAKGGTGKNMVEGMDTSRFPVEQVSWDDCQAFIRKLNVKGGVEKVFGKAGTFALPHEDQWEYAYRGGKGNKQPFYWGDELNGDKANCNGNYPYGGLGNGKYLERTTEVGSYATKAPHPWGLCDMSGNVWQLFDIWYDSEQKGRVLRGGSWNFDSRYCRAASRLNNFVLDDSFNVGFRVCFRLD